MTGTGRFTDDLSLPRQAHGYVLRSPHAHARIGSIDTGAAEAAPGVLAVLTAFDAVADRLGDLPCIDPVSNRDGTACAMPPYPILAVARVRHVGEAVAFVVAESVNEARDAAELIRAAYAPIPAVVDPVAALDPKAPRIWEEAPGNLCADWACGDEEAVAQGFLGASHVTSIELVNNRLVVASMEPRGAIGAYDAGEDRYTLHTGGQGAHNLQRIIAGHVLAIPFTKLRVVIGDVGGGFGMKSVPYREQALVLWAARRVGRPVKWISERSDSFLSDTHARDHVTRAQLALDRDGRMLALRVSTVAAMGAHLSAFAPAVPTEPGSRMLCGQYRIPAVSVETKAVFTNTVPVDAYRGAGRPEAAYLIERLVDLAARETGLAPDELRRRNLVTSEAFPHRTPTGLTYDSGTYERNLDDALGVAGWPRFASRRKKAQARGRLAGIGMAAYVEICGVGESEMARVRFDSSGAVTLFVGTQSNGQGHETAFARLAARRLGLPEERVRVVQGDTDRVGYGRGTGGSRSLQICGPAIHMAVDKVIAKARLVAAHVLEAAEADIEFRSGLFAIAGTDRTVSFDEVRLRAFAPGTLPPGIEPGLDEQAVYKQEAFTFPNGCHIAEVEVDPETGAVEVVRYVAVDDFGTVFNPALVEGQVHGSVAQGLGQALIEDCRYDRDGQLLTASFLDYALPRASELPRPDFRYNEVPSPANPLGVKGCAEAGCVGAPPAVVNAVLDALAPLGVRRLDMPLTPGRVWAAIRDARGP
ncbi:MAG: xanthine dehydrogenase family protein molybdopterin-binding subunit [Alphaproteobacteria bacterium]